MKAAASASGPGHYVHSLGQCMVMRKVTSDDPRTRTPSWTDGGGRVSPGAFSYAPRSGHTNRFASLPRAAISLSLSLALPSARTRIEQLTRPRERVALEPRFMRAAESLGACVRRTSATLLGKRRTASVRERDESINGLGFRLQRMTSVHERPSAANPIH
jgi:hypothetical protein